MDGIHEAIALGTRAYVNTRLMTVNLHLTDNRKVKLVGADGVVTAEGEEYYRKLGMAFPSIYPYDQPLINGKWVKGFDGKLVRRFLSGEWVVTPKGANYFKYNQDEWRVEYLVRRAYKPDRSSVRTAQRRRVYDGGRWALWGQHLHRWQAEG